jgi:hypothetical protein
VSFRNGWSATGLRSRISCRLRRSRRVGSLSDFGFEGFENPTDMDVMRLAYLEGVVGSATEKGGFQR